MKKIGLLALVVCLILTSILAVPAAAQGQKPITVLNSSIECDFPLSIKFHLAAAGEANITDIRLCYEIQRDSFVQVTSEIYIDFVPDTKVEVSQTLNMIKTGGFAARDQPDLLVGITGCKR
jgi:hypothetical protein